VVLEALYTLTTKIEHIE
jgi:hypothetical protein